MTTDQEKQGIEVQGYCTNCGVRLDSLALDGRCLDCQCGQCGQCGPSRPSPYLPEFP